MPFQQTTRSVVYAGATFRNPCQDEWPNPSGTSFHLDTQQGHLNDGSCSALPELPIGNSPANTARHYQYDLDYDGTAYCPYRRRNW